MVNGFEDADGPRIPERCRARFSPSVEKVHELFGSGKGQLTKFLSLGWTLLGPQ